MVVFCRYLFFYYLFNLPHICITLDFDYLIGAIIAPKNLQTNGLLVFFPYIHF